MADLLQNIACLAWLILSVIVFVGIKKWNKRFSELYEELKNQIEEDADNG